LDPPYENIPFGVSERTIAYRHVVHPVVRSCKGTQPFSGITAAQVTFNSIQPCTRHATGLALRFPRIKATRRDENIDSIDTLQDVRYLARATRKFAIQSGRARHEHLELTAA
jgi:hypothetical protein